MEGVFDRETKKKARTKWRLLMVDGHGSHLTMRFIKYCLQNKILLSVFPSHSTHRLQPLDVGIFSPLARAYSNKLVEFMFECQGLCSITKRDFLRLFWMAWTSVIAPKTVEKAFSSTGIWPVDASAILKKIEEPKDDSRPPSSHSKIDTDDWRTVRAYWKSCVRDPQDVKTQKIFDWLMALSSKNTILQFQNFGLEKALKNERKRKQVNRPIAQAVQGEQPGQSIIWSPHKLNRALEVLKAKEEELELKKKFREAQKLQKAAPKVSTPKKQRASKKKVVIDLSSDAEDQEFVPSSPTKNELRGAEIARKLAHLQLNSSQKTPKKQASKNTDSESPIGLAALGVSPTTRTRSGRQTRATRRALGLD